MPGQDRAGAVGLDSNPSRRPRRTRDRPRREADARLWPSRKTCTAASRPAPGRTQRPESAGSTRSEPVSRHATAPRRPRRSGRGSAGSRTGRPRCTARSAASRDSPAPTSPARRRRGTVSAVIQPTDDEGRRGPCPEPSDGSQSRRSSGRRGDFHEGSGELIGNPIAVENHLVDDPADDAPTALNQ